MLLACTGVLLICYSCVVLITILSIYVVRFSFFDYIPMLFPAAYLSLIANADYTFNL